MANSKKLIIAISSRALFDLDESNGVYEKDGMEAYARYQVEHENDLLQPGVAFPLVKKLLNLNRYGDYVEVILLSRNSADTGLRIFNCIREYQLNITKAVFTSGATPHRYAQAFKSDLFLSANGNDVREALKLGCTAVAIMPLAKKQAMDEQQLRIAFDGDAVLFADDAERIYQQGGLAAFTESESQSAMEPLAVGPLHGFLMALNFLQQCLPIDNCPIRTALVTARSAPAHERVIRTFRHWGIRIDESFFLGGLEKGAFLEAFSADIFFDDQKRNCLVAMEHVATGHVPYGIKNEKQTTQ